MAKDIKIDTMVTLHNYLRMVDSFRQKSEEIPKSSIYRVLITFCFEKLTCMREIAVSSATTLEQFHTMIQACGGWLNYHLYDFEFIMDGRLACAKLISPDLDISTPAHCWKTFDSAKVTLEEAFSEFPSLLYHYDYGDGWELSITKLGRNINNEEKNIPYCISGKGDWPPDDVGGEGGFDRYLEIIKNPNHVDYNYMMQWGYNQGFEKYSLAKCNRNLAHWEEFAVKM